MRKQCLLFFLLLCLTACHHAHDHDAHGHEHGEETRAHEGDDHAHEGDDHAHGEEDHAHGGDESTQLTLWDNDVELFIEYPPFIVGEPTILVTHVTHIKDWQPRVQGEMVAVLSSLEADPIEVVDKQPARAGIYTTPLTFPSPGTWEIEIQLEVETGLSIQVIPVQVYASDHDAAHAEPAPHNDDEISFLKEQQWNMAFASEPVREKQFRESISANGVIQPRSGGEVVVHAPVSGRLEAGALGFPHIGARVEKGQALGSLIPQLSQAADPSGLELDLRNAQIEYRHAEKNLQRTNGLVAKEAIPKVRLHAAELEFEAAEANLKAAQERLNQLSAMQDGSAFGARVKLHAPLTGTVVETEAVAGAITEAGERLFRIIDLDKVWLNIQIPEGDVGRITQTQGAWFTINGMDQIFQVGDAGEGRFVALGGEIDPRRRTVPLLFELPNQQGQLKVGMFAEAAVLTGKAARGIAVPNSALLEEAGQVVAYVQTGGESFDRRILRLGIRDGDYQQVLSGLKVGERVVTKGAYQVRLAGSATSVPDHGHAH